MFSISCPPLPSTPPIVKLAAGPFNAKSASTLGALAVRVAPDKSIAPPDEKNVTLPSSVNAPKIVQSPPPIVICELVPVTPAITLPVSCTSLLVNPIAVSGGSNVMVSADTSIKLFPGVAPVDANSRLTLSSPDESTTVISIPVGICRSNKSLPAPKSTMISPAVTALRFNGLVATPG